MRLPRFLAERLDRAARGVADRLPPVPGAGVDEVLALLAAGALLVDVRDEREWRAGTAAGAGHLPLRRLRAAVSDLPEGQHVVLLDEGSGYRAAAAARLLDGRGRRPVVLEGGLAAWARAGHPVLPGR